MKTLAWVVVSALLVGSTTLYQPPRAHASELSISGVVWDDQNGDGVRQPGEIGMPNLGIELGKAIDGKFVFRDSNGRPLFNDVRGNTIRTDANGRYEFANLQSGSYAVRISLGTAGRIWFLTYPARRGFGDYDVAVTLESQSLAGVNFGLYFAAGVPSFRGVAWINAAPANLPRVRTFIDGVECTAPGGILPTSQLSGSFLVGVAPVSLLPGCGETGKTVRFTVNGQPANETVAWQPAALRPPAGGATGPLQPPWREIDLTVGPAFAYFLTATVDEEGFPTFVLPSELHAYIDGTDCGQIAAGTQTGFVIVVPSREMTPGCGYEGAIIDLELEGATVGQPFVWHPGRLEAPPLVAPGAARERSITPPRAGDAGLMQP